MYQLYDRGHIKSLDDPLSHYCSKFSMKNPYDLENVVTLRYGSVWIEILYVYIILL